MKIALSLALIAGSLFGVVQAPYPIAPGAATGLDSANAAVDKYPASEVDSPEDTLAYWTKERMAQAVANSGAATAEGRSAAGSAGASAIDYANSNPAVGVVFYRNSDGDDQVCTGTVINDNAKNVVLTAGSCLHGGAGKDWSKKVAFAPEYSNGTAWRGLWAGSWMRAYQDWTDYSRARLNQAVFRVWPNSQGQEIEDQVRGHKLLTVSSPEQGNVQAYSYRRDPGSAVANQWYCENAPSWGKKGELGTLGCRFPNPTAGSPWVKYIDDEGYGSIFAVSSSFRYDGDISYLPEAYSNPTNLQTEIVNKLKKVDDPA